MQFRRENTQEIIEDIIPLLFPHYDEISKHKDIPLDPDWDSYFQLDKAGCLRIYAARDEENKLCGYQIFILRLHPHYRTSLQAFQSLLFIDPKHRGFGMKFMKWCDEQLKQEGVQLVYQTVTTQFDFSPILKRMGYEPSETMYSRRLN